MSDDLLKNFTCWYAVVTMMESIIQESFIIVPIKLAINSFAHSTTLLAHVRPLDVQILSATSELDIQGGRP